MVIDIFTEDIDFSNTPVAINVVTTAGYFRNLVRCTLQSTGSFQPLISNTFAPVSSAWLMGYVYTVAPIANENGGTIGFGSLGSIQCIGVGLNNGNSIAINLQKGSTFTVLASSSIAIPTGQIFRIDLQIVNYGTNGTVNVYVNGAFAVSYTGDLTGGSGATTFNTMLAYPSLWNSATQLKSYVSEIVVADESTLGWQGVNMRQLTGNGTVQQFSNPGYTNFNPTVINDANSTYSNTAGQDEQAAFANSVVGSFTIKAVKIVARANAPAGSAITNLKLGLANGSGTIGVGTAHTVTDQFLPYSDILTIDPTTGQPFTSIDGYQLDLRSA